MMSTESEAGADVICCASCGIAENDDIKLKICTSCELVRYCSVKCQRNHFPQHEEECKKRAAEIYDELLFKQPESSHLGDCPICCLPIPFDPNTFKMLSCCSKMVCKGCWMANTMRERQQSLVQTCPFCRHRVPKNGAESDRNNKKRAENNDPVALRELGFRRFHKHGDKKGGFECWSKAVLLGDTEAHFVLSNMYHKGKDVQKDMKKAIYHAEQAAIGGHPVARHNLGCHEKNIGQIERAVKHFIIAANIGDDSSLTRLRECYNEGHVQKEDFAAALRAHQAAVDATKSPQREEAANVLVNESI
jgi:hypothetical protein